MVHFVHWLALLSPVATAYAAVSVPYLHRRDHELPPSKDPFYDVPDNITDYEPGAILNHRRPPSPIGAYNWHPGNLRETQQVLYRTTDSLGNATATVMTVMIPENADLNKLVSFQVAEDAASIDCAPSYGFQLPTQSDRLLGSGTIQVQLLLIEGALAKGWVVLVEDVAGPRGAYGANKLAGHSILDGIRAALQSGDLTGISKDSKVVMWGYSGGAGITRTAADLQPIYAPELDIAGAAFGGAGASDPTQSLHINKTPHAGLIVAVLLGIANQYQDYADLIDQQIKPLYRVLFYKALDQCLEANIATYSSRDILGMFYDWRVLFKGPVALKVFSDGLVDSVSEMPMFWYQNVEDDLVPIEVIDAQVKEYCGKGANVRYQRNDAPSTNHQNYGLIGTTDVLAWFEELFDGKLPERGCSTKTVHQAEIDPGFLKLFPDYIQSSLLKFGSGKK